MTFFPNKAVMAALSVLIVQVAPVRARAAATPGPAGESLSPGSAVALAPATSDLSFAQIDRSAAASGLMLVGSITGVGLLALQLTASPNQCLSYTYDLNGNVITRTNAIYGATARWGSSPFGCFDWAVAP
jgi:hypothetical protein